MRYTNPVVRGFYPDPSVTRANGKYYMVNSSFQYFPGVPLFESEDLVNWKQIGNVLTRKSQVKLDKINSSGGVFAPTIRFNNGRFYMVTTNDTTHENFYVWTDDIYSEWSDPVGVEQGGIDPSLLFDDDGKAYFISNGSDESGKGVILECEINIETGRKLTESIPIWGGSGQRYLESPHMYKINGEYYLMAAEGGTEYGHMVTYARSKNVFGPFAPYDKNPVLTNRHKAPGIIQGIGHGDLVQDYNGGWHIVCLGFRQIHIWQPYHTLGREVFMIPVHFGDDGWFTAGNDGTASWHYEIEGDFAQERKQVYTFDNTDWKTHWLFLRHPRTKNYELSKNAVLHGSSVTLNEADTPTFVGLRQIDFNMTLSVDVSADGGEAGVTVYSCEREHFDLMLRKDAQTCEAVLVLNIGGIHHEEASVKLKSPEASFEIEADSCSYMFYVKADGERHFLGRADSKYLSSEVCGGFTGVVIGLYAVGENTAVFENFRMEYKDWEPELWMNQD